MAKFQDYTHYFEQKKRWVTTNQFGVAINVSGSSVEVTPLPSNNESCVFLASFTQIAHPLQTFFCFVTCSVSVSLSSPFWACMNGTAWETIIAATMIAANVSDILMFNLLML